MVENEFVDNLDSVHTMAEVEGGSKRSVCLTASPNGTFICMT